MNDQIDKFRDAVRLGKYTEALAIFHDHRDESFVRVLLGEFEFLLKVIEDLAKKESNRRFKIILDQGEYSTTPPEPAIGSRIGNSDTGSYYRYDGKNWVEYNNAIEK